MSVETAPKASLDEEPNDEEPNSEEKAPEGRKNGWFLGGLRAVDGAIVAVEKVLLVLLVAFILIAIIFQIVGRQVGWSHPGVMEAAVFAMLAVALFSGSIATHYRRHISIDVISRLLPASVFTVLSTCINLLGFAVMLYLTRAALFYVEMNRLMGSYSSPALKLPYWWVQTLLPIAFAIIAFRFLVNFLEDADRVRTGDWLSPVQTYDAEHRL